MGLNTDRRNSRGTSFPSIGIRPAVTDAVTSYAGVNVNSSQQVEIWNKEGTVGKPALNMYTQVAASTAVSNTITETLFDKSYSIPANTLKAGSVVRVKYWGIATATNSTDTLAIKLYIGGLSGTALVSHAAVDVANNDIFFGECDIIVRTAGASGTMVARGLYKTTAAEGTATMKDDILASTTLDTTAAQVVGVSATWSVASSSNSCRLDFLTVDLVSI